MRVLMFVLFIAFLLIGGSFLLEKWLIKKLQIQKPPGLYRPTSPFQKQGERFGFLSLLIVLVLFFNHPGAYLFILFIYFTVLWGFRAYMEWRNEPETRRYILSSVDAAITLLLFSVLLSLKLIS
ncbi:MAG: DUF4181 domain-containing protein [Sporolactobacillus sp.]